jgi:hypothetical protein
MSSTPKVRPILVAARRVLFDALDALVTHQNALSEHPDVGPSVTAAVTYLDRRFRAPRAAGTRLAVQALTGAVPDNEVRELCVAWTTALFAAY